MGWLLNCCVVLEVLISPFAAHANEVVFKKTTMHLGATKLKIELAETEEQHARGLMNRRHLGEDEGMLFVFRDEDRRSFWMKNTFVDLSIGFFDKNKVLVDIQDMAAVTSVLVVDPPSYVSREPAKYALEVKKGWFERHKIKLKQKFRLD